MKIDSQYIKANIKCAECGGSNLVRRAKQNVFNTVNGSGEIIDPYKLTWRAFECPDCEEITTHTTDDGITMKVDHDPYLPFTCFDYYVEQNEEIMKLWMWLNEKTSAPNVIADDDLRDEHVRNLKIFFKKNGMGIDNIMECAWEVFFDPALNISSYQEARDHIHKAMKTTGSAWVEEQEKNMHEENKEWYQPWTERRLDHPWWSELDPKPVSGLFIIQ